jgi:hypothetical protein
MALKRLTVRRPRGRVPEPDRPVARARRDQPAVRREGDRPDRTGMALERLQNSAPIRLPFRNLIYGANTLLKLFPDDALLGSKDKGRAVYLEGCLLNY